MRIFLAGLLLAAGTSVATADTIETGNVVASVTGDWNRDGAQDLALLVRGSEGMDLYFFLQDAQGLYLKPAGVAREKVWGVAEPDGMMGREPNLRAMPNGSIQVQTQNSGMGRDRWTQTLTIAYRNTDFIVAGFTYSWYDTLDTANNGSCDLNVLTGKGEAEKPDDQGGLRKVAIATEPQFIPFKDWPDDAGIRACGISE